MSSGVIADFIRAQTTLVAPPLMPSIELHLATDARGIFQATHEFCGGEWPPYWAFAWPGGQAMARHIVENPRLVDGKTVLDLGAGSGIAAIAASLAGADRVIAADTDPLAAAAIAINAAGNAVELETVTGDMLGCAPEVGLVLIGDLVYEPELATRVTGFLEAARKNGTTVLLADRTTARRPDLPFELVAEHHAPLTPMLEENHFESARVWRLVAANKSHTKPQRNA